MEIIHIKIPLKKVVIIQPLVYTFCYYLQNIPNFRALCLYKHENENGPLVGLSDMGMLTGVRPSAKIVS